MLNKKEIGDQYVKVSDHVLISQIQKILLPLKWGLTNSLSYSFKDQMQNKNKNLKT